MSKAAQKKVYRLAEHSIAKIECYRKYLEIYLAVLANTLYKSIYILDLFAGEGKDIDGNICSSIAAAQVLDEHYKSDNKKCTSVTLFLNDPENSVIEPEIKKIKRVKRFIEEISLPPAVKIVYGEKQFEELIPSIITRLNNLQNGEKALCFIDPFGYKYSKPETIKDILLNGNTEVLLFIPICFMHRFAAKAIKDNTFVEGKHIEEFISVLFQEKIPNIKNQIEFIKSIQSQFKIYLKIQYVDVLYIEKEKGQYFALYFFSNSKRGFQKMLEAKWAVDELNGRGFAAKQASMSNSLFADIDHEDYSSLVLKEINSKGFLTNQEAFDFGLNNNHLPKHTKKVLDGLKKLNLIIVQTESGSPAAGYYLEDNHSKKILIKKR